MKNRSGYTLLEVSIATAILTVVSLLSFMVIRSSAEASQVTAAKDDVQSNLRNVMSAISAEVRQAYTERIFDGTPPDDVVAITATPDGKSISFMVPQPSDASPIPEASALITIRHDSEDGGEDPNARLDGGEDENGDGALTRRVIRTQGNNVTTLGASNDVSDIQFQLLRNPSDDINAFTELRIWLEATKRYGPGEGKLVRAQLESVVSLQN